jgi:pyridoxal phosphate enzyme (YggS family)
LNTTYERVQRLLQSIPSHVTVVAAAKGASPGQVTEAIQAGIRVVGQNYMSDVRVIRSAVSESARWHFIGRLQPHSVRAANLRLLDAVQSVDSLALAERINTVSENLGRELQVFIEVNSGLEAQKSGVLPEAAERLIREIAPLRYLRIVGLMTMGPQSTTREGYRPCFAETRQLFEHIEGLDIPGVHLEHLSMGMSDSYEVAIEEGATMVRLGTLLFGAR